MFSLIVCGNNGTLRAFIFHHSSSTAFNIQKKQGVNQKYIRREGVENTYVLRTYIRIKITVLELGDGIQKTTYLTDMSENWGVRKLEGKKVDVFALMFKGRRIR